MKTLFTTLMLASVLIIGAVTPTFSQSSEQLFQKGMIKEEGEGALQEAIDLYKQVVDLDNAERTIKAKALLQIGICYQKLGNEEAQNAFQKLIQEYGEQTDVVSEAKKLLSQIKSSNTGDIFHGVMLQQVWVDAGMGASGGSLSSRGHFLSITDETTGNLAYREVASGKTINLTKDASWANPLQFSVVSNISPDDKQISYGWYNKEGVHEVRLTDIADPQPKVIYNRPGIDAFPGPWSPDGRKLFIFGLSKKEQVTLVLDVGTGEKLNLPMKKLSAWFGMAYSPDGNYIVYDTPVEKDKNKQDIMIISADGTTESILIEHPADERLLGWIPGSDKILFLSDRTGTYDAYTVAIFNGRAIGNPKRILAEAGQIRGIDFTENGDFYFINAMRKNSAFVAPLNEDATQIDMEAAELLPGSNYRVEYSPSGKYMAYMKELILPNTPGGYYSKKIFIRNNSTKEEVVVPKYISSWYPTWSPDEKNLYLIGKDNKKDEKDYNGGIYKVDLKTGKADEIVLFPKLDLSNTASLWTESRLTCSKDNSELFYLYGNVIKRRNMASGKDVVLVENTQFSRFLDLSPDGKLILFGTYDSENKISKLYSVLSSGGQPQEIFIGQKNEVIDIAKWEIDGQNIVFHKGNIGRNQKASIWRIDKGGKNPQQIWQAGIANPVSDSYYSNSVLSIHPDGKHIAISTYEHAVEFWRMTNMLNE